MIRVGYMYRRRRYRRFSFPAAVSRWWRNVRYRAALHRHVLIFTSLAAAVVATFGVLLHSTHAAKVDRQNLACLALNVYYEARGEPRTGQYAVAEVTMNRVASSRYPGTVCRVVYQKNWDRIRKRYVSAFSWTEFNTLPEPRGLQWASAREVAEEVYYRRKEPTLADALYYHANYIRPRWSREKTRVAQIGNHIFYR